jgi:hypothetical protein
VSDERVAITDAVARLTAADARTEVLAVWRTGRRLGPIRRPDALEAVGWVWRLGAVLLDAEGRLYTTGTVIQAQPLRFDNHQSNRAAERRELRAAVEKAGVAPGETVDVDAVEVDPDDLREVSWDGSGDPGTLVPLARYLRERADLLADPPEGSTPG